MSKAGPLTRSGSKSFDPAEPPAGNNNSKDAVQASSNTQSPQPRGGDGRRFHSDEIIIGLALGSPRQNPLPALPPEDREVDPSNACSSPENSTNMLGNACEIHTRRKGMKGKGSKWKSLGYLFGRGEIRSASPSCQLDRSQQSERANQSIPQDSLETNALHRKWAGSNHVKKAHQVYPSMCMSGEESSGLLRRNSSRRRGLRRRKVEDPQPEMLRIPAKYAGISTAENVDPHGEQRGSRMPGPSLLEVEIPCVELERYSVMFGDVLETPVRRSKPQPSLLARRQAQLEELQTIAGSNSKPFDLDLPIPAMRADSVSSKSSTSPSFSLFPATPPLSARSPVIKLLQKPSPLSRSVTAPSHHLFPSRPAIKKSKTQDQEHGPTIIQNPDDIPWTPTFHCRQFTYDRFQPPTILTTTNSVEYVECPGYSYPNLETDPLLPAKDAKQECLQRAFPARKSSMKKPAPPEPGYKHKGEDTEVSVARKISISRRQRQFLVPIVPKTARQPMQPRVKEQSTTEESRKSHHLTLEDA